MKTYRIRNRETLEVDYYVAADNLEQALDVFKGMSPEERDGLRHDVHFEETEVIEIEEDG